MGWFSKKTDEEVWDEGIDDLGSKAHRREKWADRYEQGVPAGLRGLGIDVDKATLSKWAAHNRHEAFLDREAARAMEQDPENPRNRGGR